MLEVYRCNFVDWKPSPVVALATSLEGTLVAAGRESGEIEIWKVAAGSVGWTIQSRIPGRKDAAVSSLAWCLQTAEEPHGKLFSSGQDGSITEWDLNTLKSKSILDCYGGPVWDIAVQPLKSSEESNPSANSPTSDAEDGWDKDSNDDSDREEDENGAEERPDSSRLQFAEEQQLAVACDDGCVRLFSVTDAEGAQFKRSFPKVSGRILSTAWNSVGSKLFAGGSDGCIRCWDADSFRELYRITAGSSGISLKDGLCIWSIAALNDETETIVSGDASGSVQFWDGRFGTLIQSQTRHRAAVLSLAASPNQDAVFAGGVDGQVILFQRLPEQRQNSTATGGSGPWVYLGGRRPHSHDVKALTVGIVPSHESDAVIQKAQKKQKKMKRDPAQEPPRWQKPGVAMLISGGNDAQLFTYPADSFMDFYPHAVCPSPQVPPMQLTNGVVPGGSPLLLVQQHNHLEVWKLPSGGQGTQPPESVAHSDDKAFPGIRTPNGSLANGKAEPSPAVNGLRKKRKSAEVVGNEGANGVRALASGARNAGREVLERLERKEPTVVARIKSSGSEHLSCSAISPNGTFVAFSDSCRVRLFELTHPQGGGNEQERQTKAVGYVISKRKLPAVIPPAHQLAFSADSGKLIVACREGGITVYDMTEGSLVNLSPASTNLPGSSAPSSSGSVPPVTSLLAVSKDGRWLASADISGNISVFSLKRNKLYWSVPSFDDFPTTAIVFHPTRSELILSTSANQIQVLDVKARDKSDWSKANKDFCPPELLGLPCGISGLSISPSGDDKLLAYSSRYMCFVDLKKPFVGEEAPETASMEADDSKAREKKKRKSRGGKEGEESALAQESKGASNASQEGSRLKVIPFRDRTLFVGHTSSNSVILMEKEWDEVLKTLPPPFKYHKFGT